MTDLGGLSARIGLNTTGLRAGRVVAQEELLRVEGAMLKTEAASSRLGGAFNRLGTTTKVLGGLLGLELARKAGEGIKVAVEYAVDLESTMARVKRVFGSSSEEVVKFSDTADKTLGRTKDQALTASVRFGTLATRLGQTKEQAAKTSIALTKLATDLAASKGGSVDDAATALSTGLVGRGMALRRYGIVLTDTNLKEEAVRDGLLKSNKDALTPSIKLQAAYNTILRQTTDIQGYFGDHLDLIIEKQLVAAATTVSASEALGNALIPAEKALADLLANDVAPALKVTGEALGWVSDHQLTRDVVVFGGGLLVAAKAATVLHKAFLTLKADTAAIFGSRAAATESIVAEGAAAERTAGQLGVLAAAETRAGTAATVAAAEVRAGATVMSVPGLGGAGPVGGPVPAAGAKPGLPSILGGGVGLVLTGGILYGVSQIQAENARMSALNRQVAAGKDLPVAERQKQAASLGVSRGSNPGQYITDPKRDRNDITAGIRLLDETGQGSVRMGPIHLSPLQLAAEQTQAATDAHNRTRASVLAAQQALHDPATLNAEAGLVGGSLGGLFDALPSRTGNNADAVASANLRVQSAQARVDKLSAGGGKASQSSILSAQAAVLSAEDTLRKHKGDTTAQTLRLQAAEERLATLRSGGKVNTSALAIAEGQLTLARKKADEAAKKNGTTAIGVGDLLSKALGQNQNVSALNKDADRLIKDGISKPVMENLVQLEKTAPGTMDRIAREMTPAMAKRFDSEEIKLEHAQKRFLTAPLRAALTAAKAENAAAARELAKAQADAYKAAIAKEMLGFTFLGSAPPSPTGPAMPGDGRPNRGTTGLSKTTVYSMPGATIVANDPAALAAELARRARVSALAGTP